MENILTAIQINKNPEYSITEEPEVLELPVTNGIQYLYSYMDTHLNRYKPNPNKPEYELGNSYYNISMIFFDKHELLLSFDPCNKAMSNVNIVTNQGKINLKDFHSLSLFTSQEKIEVEHFHTFNLGDYTNLKCCTLGVTALSITEKVTLYSLSMEE